MAYLEEYQVYQEDCQSNLQKGRRAYSRLGLAVLVLFAVYLVASYALMYAVAYLLPDIYNQWWFTWVLNLVPLYCFALPAFFLCLRGVEKGAHNESYVSRGMVYTKPKFHFGHWCLFAVVGFGLMYVGSLIGNGIMSWMSEQTGYDYQNSLSSLSDNSPWWMILLGTVIIAPIGEEFMFRKLLIDRARRYGDGVAILVSALLFALFHGNLFQFFYAFFLGLIMAYMYTLSGKLYWSIGLHIFANFMGMMAIPKLGELLKVEELSAIDPNDVEAITEFITTHPTEYALILLMDGLIYGAMAAAVILVICWVAMKKVYLGKGEVRLSGNHQMMAAFANVGIPLCIVLLLAVMAVSLIPLA